MKKWSFGYFEVDTGIYIYFLFISLKGVIIVIGPSFQNTLDCISSPIIPDKSKSLQMI